METSKTQTPHTTTGASEATSTTHTQPRIEFFVGSYSDSIPLISYNESSNTFETLLVIPNIRNPSFLKYIPSHELLLAVSETQDSPALLVIDLKVTSPTYKQITQTLPTHGADPCHICYSAKYNIIFCSNYSGSSMSYYAFNPANRTQPLHLLETLSFHNTKEIAVKTARQEASHPHSVTLSSNEDFAFLSDLGCDVIRIYSLQSTQSTQSSEQATPPSIKYLRSIPLPTGTGPRHLFVVENTVYVLGELSNVLFKFEFEAAKVEFNLIGQAKLLNDDHPLFAESTAAEIKVDSSSTNLVFVSIRGVDEIVVVAFEQQPESHSTSSLTKQQTGTIKHRISTQGKQPRNFNLNEKHLLCANQGTDTIILFDKLSPHHSVAQLNHIVKPTYIEFI